MVMEGCVVEKLPLEAAALAAYITEPSVARPEDEKMLATSASPEVFLKRSKMIILCIKSHSFSLVRFARTHFIKF